MASARPSAFKQGGGGSFNGVDGKITGYEFSTSHPFSDSASNDYVYAAVTAAIDGSDEDQTTAFLVGNADDFEIEDDGHTLVPVDPDGGLRANSPFSKFVVSMITGGFPESSLPEDRINFEAFIGSRVRFVQVNDVDAQGNVKMRKAKKGKFKGKEFPQTHTEVSSVIELPGAKKGGTKAAAASSKSKKAVADDDDAVDVDELATETLLGILRAVKGDDKEILKKKLPVAVMNTLGGKHPQREDVRKKLGDDEFLSIEAGWSYDKKSQLITLDE